VTARKYHTIDFENPQRELFLWAVLLNRKELALLFWKSGVDQIGELPSWRIQR
jgi:hypothetical protein